MAIVTISASYAAGGSEIAPHVARRLGLPFIDRAIPVAVAGELGVPVEQVEAAGEDERPNRFWSMVASMAVVPDYLGSTPGYVHVPSEREMCDTTERELRRIAATDGGVVLGRAAALVLPADPSVLHVRLDGDPDGRVRAAMRQHGISEAEARAARKTNDAARAGYVRHFYRRDAADPALYDLVIDTVRFGWAATENLIVTAARLRGIGAPTDAA